MDDPRQDPGLAAWQAVLDRIAYDVGAFEAALADEREVEVATWQMPPDLGPLPEELREEATRVAAELARAQQTAARHRDEIGSELRELDRRRSAGQAYASVGGAAGQR